MLGFAPGKGDRMPNARLEVLSEEDCRALLRQGAIGRVAVSVGAIPEIFPVNFCLIDDSIFFRTARGTKLFAAALGAVVAFQVDNFDVGARQGWSVLVVGPTDEVTQPDEIARAKSQLDEGWVPGGPDRVLRVTPYRVSGRRTAVNP